MDRELAGAVLRRWEEGLPVAETTFYKAASALGVDPASALIEARFYTVLDHYLTKQAGQEMPPGHLAVCAAALGVQSLGALEKAASAYGFTPTELVIESLRERGFRPDSANLVKTATAKLTKKANLSGVGGDPTVAQGAGAANQDGPIDPAAMTDLQGQPLGAVPQQGANVQQSPQARFKPSPTAPDQAPPSPEGNLESLLQDQQQIYGDQAMNNGGLPPAGQPQPPPPPPASPDRIRQVAPDIDDETAQRYGEQLDRLEQTVGMPVQDPKQMVKLVKELQKVDGKRIDQGIKAMGEQLEQEQAAELGVGQPTVNGGTTMPPAPGAGGGGPQAPGAQAQGMGQKPKPQPQQAPQQAPQAAQQAAQKVANAARVLARGRNS